MYFLIDFENVQESGFVGAHLLNRKDSVIIFFSEQCKTIDGKVFSEIQKSKCKLDTRKLVKASPNALDFYIASETGRIFGSGYSGEVAIVSKDNGFHAVADYWSMGGQGKKTVITGATMERCMLSSKVDEDRVRTIKQERMPIVLETLGQAASQKEQKSSTIKELYKDTPYAEHSAKVEAVVLAATDKMSIYQNIIKEFGTNPGVEIYRCIKPLVKTLNLPPHPVAA